MKFALLWLAINASAAEPVVTAWILSRPAANPELRKVLPEVHEVIVEDQFVEVRSAGLSLTSLGTFQNPLGGGGGVRDLRFRLPRKPVFADGATDAQAVGPGVLGVFRNGVPLYNRFAEASYLGRNTWHFDTIAFKDPSHPASLGVLEPMLAKGDVHSPLLGFALDGFPIYGPWAFSQPDGSGGVRRMSSGYRLRKIQERTRWPDGPELTPSQYGPPVGSQFPLGTFAEDYEYQPAAGDLDASNGRFAVTPDYPQGTYAYFLSSDQANRITFPYFLTGHFRGRLPGVAPWSPQTPNARVHFGHEALVAGRSAELRFRFPAAPFLEIVHERPVHLMAVSADLEVFDHIHPEWKPGGVYAVTHTFPRAGKYRLFAQFTRPGEPERLETFDVVVAGRVSAALPAARIPVPITVELRRPPTIQTGQDISFTAELRGDSIEPYLGAWGHFVFLDQNLGSFIHAHPVDNAGAAPDPNLPHIHGVSDVAAGPPPSTVRFSANFAKPGRYQLWCQFQVAGRPVVVPFKLMVDAAPAVPQTRRDIPAAAVPAGAIPITVDARGFTPARITGDPARRMTLAVTRDKSPNCGSQIVFPSLRIKRDLPLGETTLIELPQLTGELAFTCGMGMYRGVIVATAR